ncbi:MAG: 2,3-bisphosphoglycerate-independent phosphoglycerate mutase [Ardenticatenaceae bacterium]|nr:2,3-bisphosphoglycerate-independent phosphoglycerate mutase [Ardenticatenaceae bacterium]
MDTPQLTLMRALSVKTRSRVLLIVLDGIGDLPVDGRTPLEAARTPALDELASGAMLGLSTAVGPGITPGSGPGHLALFGYDPLVFEIGRGVLSALGIGLDLGPEDVAARGNFATLGPDGMIADRRAGRIPTALNETLVARLRAAIPRIGDIDVSIYTESEYRFVVVFSGEGLSGEVLDADPQVTGVPPLAARPATDSPAAARMASVANRFIALATEALSDASDAYPANTVLLRGFAGLPDLPPMTDVYHLTPGTIASYPMYRGLGRLVGMDLVPVDLEGEGERLEAKVEAYRQHHAEYDFIYFHIKKTDSYGEDGNFEAKVHAIETFNGALPALLAPEPEVVAITGDHSTPVILQAHSWHPLPVLVYSRFLRPGPAARFTERACATGGLGHVRHLDLMPLLMANALKLKKLGA